LPIPDEFINGVRQCDRRILAKTITLMESLRPDHRRTAREVLDGLLPYAGKSVRIGITGVPGVGKSTFIEAFGLQLIEQGHKVAVLAVDPSSTRSGGSILADKTRMEQLSHHPDAFIRPSPSGGTLGGVAARTREVMLICEAAGFDVVLIETVGVGQSETAVAGMSDFFLVLMLAGAGDEIQGIKKGVLELADTLVINKADGSNVQRAEKAQKELQAAMHLLRPASQNWSPPVLTSSAAEKKGLDEVWKTILKHRKTLQKSGELDAKRRRQAVDWMWALVDEGLKERLHSHPAVKSNLPLIENAVAQGSMEAVLAAQKVLALMETPPKAHGDK
jgi:LAO/AO transport system kinase